LALALFVLPFILGVYRGVWNRKRQEFALQLVDPHERAEYVGDIGLGPRYREASVALTTAAGAALVALVEIALLNVSRYEWPILRVPDIWLPALWVFIGSFLFYVFALLIGAATGGQQDRHDKSRSTWRNPQLILGLVGTVTTAVATVFAAIIGG